MTDGSRVPVRASWNSPSYGIVTINTANQYVVAVGPGRAMITAQADGRVAAATLVVLDPTAVGPSQALGVESFSVIEFQYSSAPNHWFYAPQLRVRGLSGQTVSVLLLRFSIPGIGDASWGCAATLTSAARELNGEVYGDWAFSMDSPGHQATGDDATAIVTYLDDAGTMATRTVRGPVVRGSLPTTYGGDSGACFHGYGSTAVRPPGD